MTLNLATWLTLLRIALIPVVVAVFYWKWSGANVLVTALFLLAAFTDWLDGWIARRYEQSSPFGAFLDPVADKLMVAVVLILVVQADPKPWLAITAAVIIGREISISALREWMAELGQRATVKVAIVGKLKTVAQMAALAMLLYRESLFGMPIYAIGEVALVISAVLTLWSGALYLVAGWAFFGVQTTAEPRGIETLQRGKDERS
jgi:CDP-diacylglycerol--glycerol-3-phosphate 3-phosphatidyltransferase